MTLISLSIIPIKCDGSKAPACRWKEFQSEGPSNDQLNKWFSQKHGMAAVTGKVSGDLEVIDFDDNDAFNHWKNALKELGVGNPTERFPICHTPNGAHVFYRCDAGVEPNQKLAQKLGEDGRPKTTIETRGEGGYVLVPGSPPECHPSNEEYVLVSGDLTQIPTIDGAERAQLLAAARGQTEYIEPAKTFAPPSSSDGNRPGSDFNARATWSEVLEPHGWEQAGQRGSLTHWRRPGKAIGSSATTNFADQDVFYVFTTNAAPFEPDRAYSKFAAHTMLNHAGDFSAAAVELAEKGYGDRRQTSFASFASFAPSDSNKWPDPLREEAFHGPAGQFVRIVEPHTEADPAALLGQFLTGAGSILGKNCYFQVERTRHYPNLFSVYVGRSSKARKGTALGHVRRLLEKVDTEWIDRCLKSGLSSGEGLIYAVRDDSSKLEAVRQGGQVKRYEGVTVPGVHDKRLLVVEEEFASPLKMMSRDGNVLSPVLRNAWDSSPLNTLTKQDPLQATGAHISLIGHTTPMDLSKYLDSTEASNGYGNRHLFFCVDRARLLPLGGDLNEVDLEPIIKQLRDSAELATCAGEHGAGSLTFDEAAREMWCDIYPELSAAKPGLLGSMTARAEAQVIRLSSIYALLDSSLDIRIEHLQAALAVWSCCEASCRYLFGGSLGDPDADQILRGLRQKPEGLTRTEISKSVFNRHRSAARIDRALLLLEKHGLARFDARPTKGRPVELWIATETAKKGKEAK